MFPNIFDLSGKNNSTEEKFEGSISNFLFDEKLAQDRITGNTVASEELAESEIWQGIKAEQEERLEIAAAHYRAAIKCNPESAKAYRLLANVLKRIRQVKAQGNQLTTDAATSNEVTQKQPTTELTGDQTAVTLPITAQESPSFSQIPPQPETSEGVPPDLLANPRSNLDFSQINLFATNTAKSNENLKVNNGNSVVPSSGDMILLPNVQMSASGEVVLQESLEIAQVYVQQALVFFEQKEWDKSINSCQEALRIYPDLGEAYKIWGNCLQQAGKTAEAMGIYAKALEAQPNMAEIYCNLGSIYARSKKWQQAIEHYQKSLIIDPNCAAPYRNLARVWDALGEYDKAEDCFFKALKIEPQLISPQEHFTLAHNLVGEERLEQAIACYKHCIELKPDFLNAYVRLAQILEQVGNQQEALYYYKKLAQLQTQKNRLQQQQSKSRQQIRRLLKGKSKPALPPAKTARKSTTTKALGGKKIPSQSLPQLKSAPGKTKAAQISQYLQQIQQQPNVPQPYGELGNIYFRAQEWRKALKCYGQAVKVAPNQAKYQLLLAKALEKIGETSKADRVYYQAFSLEPDKISAEQHFTLGNRLLEQQQIKSAIACYRRAISIQPNLIEAYWQLGQILLDINQIEGAVACFQQAIKINPNNFRSYDLLASAFVQNQCWRAALKCYQKASKLQANNADIWCKIGDTLKRLQRWNEAITAYHRAKKLNFDLPQIEQKIQQIEIYQSKYRQQNMKLDSAEGCNNIENHLHQEQQLDSIKQNSQLVSAQDQEKIKVKEITYSQLELTSAWDFHNQGKVLIENNQLDEAIISFKKATQISPGIPWNYFYWAGILVKQNNLESAIRLYQKTIDLEPNFVWSYHHLGEVLLKLGRWQEAVKIFRLACQLQPDQSLFYEKLGNALCHCGIEHHDEAFDSYCRAIELNSKNLLLYHKAITVKPLEAKLYFQLAQYLSENNEWHQATIFCQMSLELESDFAPSYALLGKCAHQCQELEKAISYYQKAVNLEPQQADYYHYLGQSFGDQNNYSRAIEHYHKAIELVPDKAIYHEALGDLYCKKEDWKQAMNTYQTAKEIDRGNAAIYKKIGDVLTKKNEIAKASELYLKAVKLGLKFN